MASVSLSKKLSSLRFNNWVKASLAVLITKEGIEPFVEDEIEQFQQKCLTDICNNQGLPFGTICTNCCTENVVKCPTNKICNYNNKSRKCSYHKNSATSFLPAGCPNKICNNFRTEIEKEHRFYGPSYKNTDATQWCSKSWEVAKCFMPPDGYRDVVSASETDFNGVNSVIINCRCFQTKVTDDLSKNGNIFDKGREIGKDVRHSPSLEVEDKDLKRYFIDLDKLLSDTGHLISDNNAKLARKKLSELKNDTLLIGNDDVRKVLDDVIKVAHDNIKTQGDEFKREAEETKIKLIEATRQSLATLKSKEKVTLAELHNSLKFAIGEIENQTEVSLKRINTETDRGVEKVEIETKSGVSLIHKATDEGANKILKESETAMDQIKQTASEELKKVSAANKQEKEEEYIAAKKNLQSDLIAFYRESCSTINICPGLDEVDASLTDVYIPPYPLYSKETDPLKKVAKQSTIKKKIHEYIPNCFKDLLKNLQKETPDGKPVNSLQEIFYKQSKECMNIYLTAEPGLGKTSFVKWLSLNWCHTHNPVKEDDHFFDQEEVNQLKKFDFVFVVFLRKINDANMSVDSMIRNTILPALGRQNKYTIDMIERVMCEERCLVVLDGLDEWNVSGIPQRPVRPSCTYMTTSRPWKTCSIAFSSKEIDQMVCIENVQQLCKERLVLSIMKMFEKRKHLRKDISDSSKACNEFIKVLEDKKVTHFYGTPVILAHLMYLWNMEKSIGNSQFEIFSDIVDALFSIAKDKIDLSKFKNTRSSQISYFKLSLCETYYGLLITLGRLAFNMLFADNKLSSLVFDEEVTEKYLSVEDSNIPADEILDTCLKTGLLSKQPVYVKSKRKKYTYSFQHKTVQEYFAALYIQAEYDTNLEVMIVKKCNEVWTVIEMGTVFMFLSGVSPSISGRVFQSLPDECMQCYRDESSTVSFFEILEIQDMKVNCAIECRNNGNEEFNLHLNGVIINESIKEGKYYDVLKALVQQNALNLKSFMFVNKKKINSHRDLEIDRMANQPCISNVCFNLSDRSVSSYEIITFLSELNAKHLQLLYVSSDLPLTNDLLEKFLLFVKKQTCLVEMRLQLGINDIFFPEHFFCPENVPLSQLQLNKHLQQLTLENVPLTQLQLNDHLQQLTLANVPLSQLQLNKHLQQLTLENVPLTQLQLNDHLQQLTLANVPLSQLQLNKHLQQLTLENVPLSQLQLNEHLQQLTLANVPLSQLQLNKHLQQLTLENVPLSQLQLNEHLQQLTLENVLLSQLQLNKHLQQLALDSVPLLQLQLNEQLKRLRLRRVPYFILSKEQMLTVILQTMMKKGSVSGEDVKSVNITGSLNSLEECSMDALPITTVTEILNSLPVESKLKKLSCENAFLGVFSTPTDFTALFSTIPKLCHLQNIELKYMNICDNILELPCVDGLQLHLTSVTLTNKILYKLLSTKQNVIIHFFIITVRDDTVEYELHTSELDCSIKADSCSSIGNRIEFEFEFVTISSKSFLQFVKVVEKCNSKVNLKIKYLPKNGDNQYREGIDYAKCLSSFIVTEDVRYESLSVEIIKNV